MHNNTEQGWIQLFIAGGGGGGGVGAQKIMCAHAHHEREDELFSKMNNFEKTNDFRKMNDFKRKNVFKDEQY